jgi:transposase
MFLSRELIKCGKRKNENSFLYLFEDQQLKLEENTTLYRKLDEDKIDEIDLTNSQERAGKILIVSNLDSDPKEIFMQYKSRDRIEKLFDTYKNSLHSDILYLQDNESIFGHIFISFLSLYIYSKIEQTLKRADILISIHQRRFARVKQSIFVELDDCNLISEVPKKLEMLD